MNNSTHTLTLSEKRRAAGLAGVAARRLKPKPITDPLTTISVRASDKARLHTYATEHGITMTEAFHRKV